MKNRINLAMALVAVVLATVSFGCAPFECTSVITQYVDPVHSPGATITFANQMVGKPGWGGGVQMAMLLSQDVETVPEIDLVEQINASWKQQWQKCPKDDQIKMIIRDWRDYERKLKLAGKKVRMVKAIGYAAFKLDDPYVAVITAFIKAAGMVGGSAVFGASMPGTSMINSSASNSEGGQGGQGGAAKAGAAVGVGVGVGAGAGAGGGGGGKHGGAGAGSGSGAGSGAANVTIK